MERIRLEALPPEEAIASFRAKGYRLSFSWQDVWEEEHARAFTVAKVARLDLLQDIRAEVDRALADGTTLAEFRKRLKPVLQSKGWWGRGEVVDPVSGEVVEAELGTPRRLQTIFRTNLRTSYAAGRWERIQRVKGRRPWLMYDAVNDRRTRPQHAAWDGTVLPADDPWWDTHFPPNGWNCRCNVIQLSDRDLERRGLRPDASPRIETRPFRNSRTGRTVDVPSGVDPGFAYNAGRARLRALTPPELDRPLAVPFAGPPATVPMPEPRTVDAGRVLPAGLIDEEYLDRFLAEFGATRDRPIVFQDALGEPLVIGSDLFRAVDGSPKVTKRGRERGLLLLADAIRKPDEIRWVWS
ncbi:MAG: minor capsid protein, partial [Geminicoccaceae bacterium]|nr:minor capsid protein [Geminicoccaceae bacterium]